MNLLKKSSKKENGVNGYEILLKICISIFLALVFLLIFFLGNGLNLFSESVYVKTNGLDMEVHVLDVGLGDCILIKLPNNKTMLIDTGEGEHYSKVKSYLTQYFKDRNLNQIDYFILSHPDADHIGGASEIFKDFEVKTVYRPKVYCKWEEETSKTSFPYTVIESETYNDCIKASYEEGCTQIFSEKGLEISEYGFKIEFLSPENDTYSATNDYSAVLMLTYQSKKFLFTGDATSNIEQQLIDNFGDYLKADVLKIAHHGSSTSSTEEFLNIVNPTCAILSVGEGNNALPNVDVINRYNDRNIKIYSTESLGNFALTVEGGQIVMTKQPVMLSSLPLIFALTLLIICVIWTINFDKKSNHTKKDIN